MSEKLHEANFLTVDLRSMFKPAEEVANVVQEPSNKAISDWGVELKDRKAANNVLSPNNRQNSYALETQFFKEFFSTITNNDNDLVEQLLLLGDPLRKALKVLGFKKQTNPILAFISLKYVQEKLLKTKLLNVNTFKAIYNAVADNLIADSEFFKANDYNIIYCQDLYRKPLKDIEAYITIQKSSLKLSADTYTAENQRSNRKVFFYIPEIKELELEKRAKAIAALGEDIKLPSARAANTKLNTIELAQKINGTKIKGDEPKAHLNSKNQTALANKLTTASQIYAALQFLSINTASRKAASALTNDNFSNLSLNKVAEATAWLAAQGIMPKGALQRADADNLVGVLLGRLQELR